MGRVVRAFAGFVGLVLLLVGVPVVLWTVGRDYIPDQFPSVGEIWDRLWAQDSGQLVIGFILLLGAIAWLVMVIGFVLELPYALQRRRRTRIRGFGWAQRTASALLFMIVTGTASGLVAPAAHGSTLPALQTVSVSAYTSQALKPGPAAHPAAPAAATSRPAAAALAPTPSAALSSTPDYTVQPRDTWWSIAERTTGDGSRAGEIQRLNIGHVQVDGSTVTATTAFPKAGSNLRLPAGATITHTTATASKAAQPVDHRHVVKAGESLSEIAERAYGVAGEYPKIAAANKIADPDMIDVGQTLIIPAAAINQAAPHPTGQQHVVKTGDSLSEIAERAYGDAGEFPKIAAANKIADPDVIDVGQTLIIPAAAINEASAAPAAPSTARHAKPEDPTPVKPAAAAPTAPTKPTATDKHEQPAPQATSPAAPPKATEEPATPVATAPAAAPVTDEATAEDIAPATIAPAARVPSVASAPEMAEGSAADSSDSSTLGLIGLSGVAAAAVWAGLVLARRRHETHRRPGRMAAVPSVPAIRVERALRESAGETDIVWLDLAMRSVAAVSTPDRPVPDVVWASLSTTGLRLNLAAAAPPPWPFVVDGSSWWLPRSAELPISSATAVDQMTPLPTLTSIGVTEQGEIVLVDLERVGALQLTGDQEVAAALLRHLLVELAHQSWSDGVNVSLVGWGEDLVQLNPDRLTHLADVDAAVRALGGRIDQVTRAVADLGVDVPQARADDVAADSWQPQVLLIDAHNIVDEEQIAELNSILGQLARTGRVATAVIVSSTTAAVTGAAALNATAGGMLRLPQGLGDQSIRAAGVTDGELRQLVDLFVTAADVDEPIPASDSPATWAKEMDRSGALIPAITLAEPIEIAAPADTPEDTNDGAVAVENVVEPVVDPAAADRLQRTLSADPTLDTDLQEWDSETVTRPRIAVMGAAEVKAAGRDPGRRTWFTEVAVYLALNAHGVSLERFQADLWPAKGKPGLSRPIAKTTRNETASKVRKWLGADPATGETYVPMGTAGIYRLDNALLDVDLLQRLRKRADARAAAGDNTAALADYTQALQLVRGPVLPEAERGRSGEDDEVHWGWLSDADRREDLHVPGWIVDCAHRAVQVALTVGDLEQARWAASIAHSVSPYSNTTLMDLLVISATAGDLGAAQAHAWEVIEANEVEVPEDLPADMFAIINRIFPTGLRWISNS